QEVQDHRPQAAIERIDTHRMGIQVRGNEEIVYRRIKQEHAGVVEVVVQAVAEQALALIRTRLVFTTSFRGQAALVVDVAQQRIRTAVREHIGEYGRFDREVVGQIQRTVS